MNESLSFSTAAKTQLNTMPPVGPAPTPMFDPLLRFNRLITPANTKIERSIHSINPKAILRKLENDDLNALREITLSCRHSNGGTGLWDTLFNLVARDSLTACIFAANPDYHPMNYARTVVSSQFLDLSKPISRTHLNKVTPGDKIGIGIYDVASRYSYVLLYDAESVCFVNDSKSFGMGSQGQRLSLSYPGLNCKLAQVYRVNYHGEADLIDVDEGREVSDSAQAFIEWIVNAVNDVQSAFAWKPHFKPQQVKAFDRAVIEAQLVKTAESTELSRYEDFEEACRLLYEIGRDKMQMTKQDARNNIGDKKDQEKIPEILPIVEVATLANDEILATVDSYGDMPAQIFRFSKGTMGNAIHRETFLLNGDLADRDVKEDSQVLVLSPGTFGEGCVLRYMTANF